MSPIFFLSLSTRLLQEHVSYCCVFLSDVTFDDKSFRSNRTLMLICSKVLITVRRADSFYTLTMVIPVLALTILAPLGMLLPADTGEKWDCRWHYCSVWLSLSSWCKEKCQFGSIMAKLQRIWSINNGCLWYLINLFNALFDPLEDFGLFWGSACSFNIVYFHLGMDLVSPPYDRWWTR